MDKKNMKRFKESSALELLDSGLSEDWNIEGQKAVFLFAVCREFEKANELKKQELKVLKKVNELRLKELELTKDMDAYLRQKEEPKGFLSRLKSFFWGWK